MLSDALFSIVQKTKALQCIRQELAHRSANTPHYHSFNSIMVDDSRLAANKVTSAGRKSKRMRMRGMV
jgi:hypothetical protein